MKTKKNITICKQHSLYELPEPLFMFDYEYYDGMKISVLFDESKTFYKKRDFNTQVRSELHLSYMKKLEQEAKDGVKEGTFNITRERVLNGYRVHYERIYGK